MGRHPDQDIYPGQVFEGRWEVGHFLGDGNFSIVFECVDRVSKEAYAIKTLSVTQNSPQPLAEFENDGDLLELLAGRPNIVSIESRGYHAIQLRSTTGISVSVNVPFMVLERADATLAELVVNRHQVDWQERLDLFRQVVKGMHQMHQFEAVNRDLKGENVLLAAEGRRGVAKLSDFGRGRNTRQPTGLPAIAYEHGRGDGRFAPPEMVWGLGVDDPDAMRLADLYLIGSVFFEFATGLGITSLALGDPLTWRNRARTMSQAERERDFSLHASDLQTRYDVAYSVFAHELPAPIRQVGLQLLRQLTSVRPEFREPRPSGRRRQLPIRWDLQWLLRRVDLMTKLLRTQQRAGQGTRRFR